MIIPVRCSACGTNINTRKVPYFAAKCCLCWDEHETKWGWTQWWQDNFAMWEVDRYRLKLPAESYKQPIQQTYDNCLDAVEYYTNSKKNYLLVFNILLKSKTIKASREHFMEYVRCIAKELHESSTGDLMKALLEVRKHVGG